MEALHAVIAAIAGYLIGSINLSIVFSRIKGRDIREMGSGNAGTTNTLRTMGKGYAAIVFVFDFLKGFLPALILCKLGLGAEGYAYGLLAIVGHCFPIYYGFKGGKGVAAAIGVLLAIDTVPALIILVEFIILVAFFRYVSLGSIVAALNVPVYTFLIYKGDFVLLAAVILLALLVIVKHKENIIRLSNGEEKPIFGKKEHK
ncbi:MAG: glycerol-3-phosphate 1-O-acyltransferase PlsY [Clostridia bacterium]|nr:glycerol-3-phosphate 1-O-acyltransferase PlsY [Clostridia bacterium]